MVNQNPQPVVFSTDFELNAGETSAMIELIHEMGAPEQMKLYTIYVQRVKPIQSDGEHGLILTLSTYQ